MFPQLECLTAVFAGASQLTQCIIIIAQSHISDGKIRIESYGALMIGQSGGRAFLERKLAAETVSLQGFE